MKKTKNVRLALIPIVPASAFDAVIEAASVNITNLVQQGSVKEPATAPSGTVAISRDKYVAELDVWKRLRCDCGNVLVISKKAVLEKIAKLTGPCDYFKFTCPGCKAMEFAFTPRGYEAEILARRLARNRR